MTPHHRPSGMTDSVWAIFRALRPDLQARVLERSAKISADGATPDYAAADAEALRQELPGRET